MPSIKQYLPNFVTGIGALSPYSFDTADQLFAIPFVASWAGTPGFSRFSISESNDDHPMMMAEMADGSYWVIGFVYGFRDLPEFIHPSHRQSIG